MMRTPIQLIRSALGDPNFDSFEFEENKNVGHFHFFSARLPKERYGGLPEYWYFGILQHSTETLNPEQVQEELRNAREMARNCLAHNLIPLLLVSDDPHVLLHDNLRLDNKNVFFLDKSRLAGLRAGPTPLHAAPFLRAVREKIDRRDLPALFFDPYRPGEPAVGWRFFGRNPELQRMVNTDQSFVLVGARRIGKTSLLKEVSRQLEAQGVPVYFVSVGDLQSATQVVEAIARSLSVRESVTAIRRGQSLNDSLLKSILKTIARDRKRVTLIIDELGNVIQRSRSDDWKIMGVFREYAQSSRLQIIVSGFQEFFVKQLQDYAGPFVNFADTMKLGVLSDVDVEELLLKPLLLWGAVHDTRRFREKVIASVGRQPLLLQHLGRALFQRLFTSQVADLESLLSDLLANDTTQCFAPATEDIFFRNTPAAERYIYLRACLQAEKEGKEVGGLEISDSLTQNMLSEAGYESTYDGRRLLMERLELVGLTTSIQHNRSRQRVSSPVIWQVIKESGPVDDLVSVMAKEIRIDADRLQVRAAS